MYPSTGYSNTDSVFAQPIVSVIRSIRHDRVAWGVLEELIFHANHLGFCYPGVNRLASLTHYAVASISSALQRLSDMGYIRIHRMTSPGGRATHEYQVSPAAMHIAPQYRELALKLWQQGAVIKNEMKYEQPDTESESPIQIQKPNLENQHHQQRIISSENAEKAVAGTNATATDATPATDTNSPVDDRASADFGTATAVTAAITQQTEKTIPQPEQIKSSAPRPAETPATTAEIDNLAWSIAARFGSTEHQMRDHIYKYGYNRVRTVYDHIRGMGRERVKNPAGLLVKYLREGWEISPVRYAESPAPTASSQFPPGHFDMFIKRY